MKRLAILIFLLSAAIASKAQQDTTSTGTIVIKKKVQRKTLYDQSKQRIIVIDHYGTLLEHHVASFEMTVDTGGALQVLASSSWMLTPEMIKLISEAKDGTIIYFTKIRVGTPDGKIENYPSTVVKVDGGFRKKSGNSD